VFGYGAEVREVLLGPLHEGGWRRGGRGGDGVKPVVDGREVAVGVVFGLGHAFLAILLLLLATGSVVVVLGWGGWWNQTVQSTITILASLLPAVQVAARACVAI